MKWSFSCFLVWSFFFFCLQCWLCWFLNDGCEYANPKVAHVLCKGSSSSCTDFVWLLSFCCHWYHYSCHSNSTWSSQPQVTLTFLPLHSFFNHDNDITLYNVSCVNILSVFIFLALCGLLRIRGFPSNLPTSVCRHQCSTSHFSATKPLLPRYVIQFCFNFTGILL